MARLGIQAAEALEHAHGMGVVHRDIKPSNLMVESRLPSPSGRGAGGEGAGGEGPHLWITDFGLAMTQTDTNLTMTGDILGTLRYMSPEQVQAKHGVLDHRTDVYSLGLTLYELLTLQPAFPGDDRQRLMRQISEDDPRPPRQLKNAIPKDLETIILKATAKEPQSRYATAQALADDLRRFQADKPIQARRPSLVERTRRWSRRHRPVVWSAAVILVTAVVALAVSTAVITRAYHAEAVQRERANKTVDGLLDQIAMVIPEVVDWRGLAKVSQLVEYAADLDKKLPEEVRNTPRHQERLARMYLQCGWCATWWGRYDIAEPALGNAITIYNKLEDEYHDLYTLDLARCYYCLGKSSESTMRPEQAEQAYLRCLELLDKAGVLEKATKDPKAGESMPLDPRNLSSLCRRAVAYVEQADLDRAIAECTDAIRLNPGEASNYKDRADAYKKSGELQRHDVELLQRAIADYEEAIRLRPTWTEPYLRLHEVYSITGQFDRLTANWDKAIRRNPTRDICYVARGWAYAETGELDKAILDFREAIRLDPKHHSAMSWLAWVYLQKGEFDRAIDIWNDAIPLAPQAAGHRLAFRGYAYCQKGDFQKAVDDCTEALRLSPNHSVAYCWRALARASLGQMEEALSDIKETSQVHPADWIDPGLYHIHLDHLAWFLATCEYSQLRDRSRAVEVAKEGLKLRPKTGFLWVTLGVAHYRQGEWIPALDALQQAAELPSHRDAAGSFFLAMTHWQLGQKEEARRSYDKAVQWTKENRPKSKELAGCRAEAAELLGINGTP